MTFKERFGIAIGVVAVVAFLGWLFVLGTAGPADGWILRYDPTTDAERQAIAHHVERVIARPMAIAGHDQDWDDTIRAAHDEARRLLCRPTLWWRAGGEFTGQWRYVPQGASPARATPP